ncbi:MAG: hypothetical protein ACREME_07695, partial [Gemmatimonadales bacterium]
MLPRQIRGECNHDQIEHGSGWGKIPIPPAPLQRAAIGAAFPRKRRNGKGSSSSSRELNAREPLELHHLFREIRHPERQE